MEFDIHEGFKIKHFFSHIWMFHSISLGIRVALKKKSMQNLFLFSPYSPIRVPKQPYAVKTKVFEIEGSNFVSKPLKGKETAWWRLPERNGPRTPPCAAPKGPKNSPKTALSHKTQGL